MLQVYRICKSYSKNHQRMPPIFVKLYTYQMCRALGHIHKYAICHRDIKPQNLLVNTENHQLKLCDFGSAKVSMGGVVHLNVGIVRLHVSSHADEARSFCLSSQVTRGV